MLESVYIKTEEYFKDIKDHLATQNGHIDDLRKFKIQAQAIIGFMAFVVSVTAGTLLTLIAAKVL